MKIVVDQLPESAKDCLFADYDNRAVGYGVWHNCKLSGITCYMSYDSECPYLIVKDDI
jgi:hypothetical protein